MSNTFGFVKTLFNSETGEFLGAHLIGPDVTEMISTFGLAISSESTEDEFINTVFAHPTLSESIHESVLSALENHFIFKFHDTPPEKVKRNNPTELKNQIG